MPSLVEDLDSLLGAGLVIVAVVMGLLWLGLGMAALEAGAQAVDLMKQAAIAIACGLAIGAIAVGFIIAGEKMKTEAALTSSRSAAVGAALFGAVGMIILLVWVFIILQHASSEMLELLANMTANMTSS